MLRNISLWLFLLVLTGATLIGPSVSAEEKAMGVAHPWQMNFHEPASPVMEKLENLGNYLHILIAVIAAFVMILLLIIIVRFNHRANPTPSKTTHNTLLEIVWTVIPIIILVAIAIPSLRVHYYMDRTSEPEMTLKVTGYQWYWGYEYPDHGGLAFESYMKKDTELQPGDYRLLSTDKPVVVPINTNVRVLLTGADVIHAWAMQSFGVKIDAVPGRLNETWFRATKPGIYYGQCSELCGVNHAFMPIELHVVEKEVFNDWVERAKNGDYNISKAQNPKSNSVLASKKPLSN